MYRVRRIVSYYARPASYSSGGVNTSRLQWMTAFARSGIPCLLVNAKGGYQSDLPEDRNLSSIALPHRGRGRQTLRPQGLEQLLRRGDLVYLHEGWTTSNLIAARICRRNSIPYVVMPHGVYASRIVRTLKAWRLRRPLEARVLANAIGIHAFFDSEHSEILSISSDANPFSAVTGFEIPVHGWSPAHSDAYIAWAGRYDILHKGIDTLFAALALIPEGERPKLRMVGPDYNGDRQRTEDLRRELGLEKHVQILAERDQKGVLDHMAASRGFVHVPRWEAFGRTIVEALALGCPVVLGNGAHIATDLGTTVRVVSSENAEEVASSLIELWSGAISGETGPAWVQENLSWKTSSSRAQDALAKLGMNFEGQSE